MSVKTALRSLVESDAEQKEKRNKDGNMERVEQILWREWSDVELNSERWDYMMKLPEKTKGKTSVKSGSITTLESINVDTVDSAGQYCDPYPVPLPWSLTTNTAQISWVRPATLNSNTRIVVYTTNGGTLFPELISRNRHILHSQLVRGFICSMHTLMYLGCTHPFRVEWPTAQYTPNTMDDQQQQPWKPWHHVYAKCRAGKDQPHMPLVNPSGKYIVRLYWMGSWRKITLDDRIPVDTTTDQVLLPLTTAGTKDELELWPLLLMKALLKIASLTWTPDNEIVDFDIITCFTGWIGQKINTRDVELDDVWEIIHNYTDKFAWEQKVQQSKSKPSSKMTSRKNSGTVESASKKDKSDKTSVKSEKSSKTSKGQKSATVVKEPSLFHLVVTCKDLRNTEETLVNNLTPCWDHDFLIEQSRDIPLVERIVDPSKELAPWKQYRWVDWAIEQGIWEREEIEDNIQCLKIVSSMKQLHDDVDAVVKENLVTTTVKIIDAKERTAKPNKKGKKDKSDKKSDSSRERKSRSQHQFVDPSVWCDFHKLGEHITTIVIYFKPSSFATNIVLSNIQFNTTVDTRVKKVNRKEDKKNKIDAAVAASPELSIKHIHWPTVSDQCNIAPVYLCTDSIDMKLVLLSAATVAKDFPVPEIKKNVDFEQPDKVICTKYVCKLGKCIDECLCQNTTVEERNVQAKSFVDTRKLIKISIEDYIWNSREPADTFIKLKSYGTKNVLMELSKGRHVKKLTIQNEKPYVLILLSNTELTVGKMDEILDSMFSESCMLTKTCYDICSAFGNLIKNFGTSDYPSSLRDFYKSYCVSGDLSKTQLELVHSCFQEELIKFFTEVFPEEQYYNISRAIKVLLLNPHFRIPMLRLNTPNIIKEEPINEADDECKCEDIDGMNLKQDSATKIQAFFKMIYIRLLKRIHDPSHKDFLSIVDMLKSIYMTMFSNKSRNTICMNLLRNLVNNEKLSDIAKYFPYYKDLNSVIWLTKFTGEIKHADAYSWVPIVRQIFHVQSTDDILIRVYLLCDLKDYMLRIFNNDTADEMERNTNEALVCKYRKNVKGYTILGYGKVQNVALSNMQWKLYIVTQKTINPLPITAEPISITSLHVRENYVANLDKLICRCIIKINHTSMISLRFSVSSDNVKIKLQCLDKNGEVLLETIDTTNVLIPVLMLEANDNSYSTENSSIVTKASIRSADTSRVSMKKPTKHRITTDKRSIQSRASTKHKRKPTVVPINGTVTEYIVQAFVLEDSWPLSVREWTVVEKLKTHNFIEDELLANSLQQSIKSNSLKLPLKKSTVHKKSNEKNADLHPTHCPKPFWTLTAVHDVGNNVQVDIDESRNEEIKMIKRECFASDPDRLLKGKQLRKEFLENKYSKFFDNDVSQAHINFGSKYSSASLTNMVVGSSYILRPSIEDGIKDYSNMNVASVYNNIQFHEDTLFHESPFRWIPTEQFEAELEDYRQYQSSEPKENILNNMRTDMERWQEHNTFYLQNVNEFMEDWRKQNVRLKEQYENAQQNIMNIWKEYDKEREQYLGIGDKAKNKKSKEKTAKKIKK